MDPDAALEALRQLCAEEADNDIAVAFADLDGWLTTGGFLPAAWSR